MSHHFESKEHATHRSCAGFASQINKPGFPHFFLRVDIEVRKKRTVCALHAALHAAPVLRVPLMTASFVSLKQSSLLALLL